MSDGLGTGARCGGHAEDSHDHGQEWQIHVRSSGIGQFCGLEVLASFSALNDAGLRAVGKQF